MFEGFNITPVHVGCVCIVSSGCVTETSENWGLMPYLGRNLGPGILSFWQIVQSQ